MSKRQDLTRWNRAGKNRFRYVDGNAVEYLEILRRQLLDKFKDPETNRCEWLSPATDIPANEQESETETLVQRQRRLRWRQERILETYHQDRCDWAWELTRTFARSCHILTEHIDNYANETYLGTASQWDHVRRLVEMLDYHPAPPASAATYLAFEVKEGQAGLVSKGFQVKNTPKKGEAKVVFETLEDLFVDSALNALQPKGWNQSEEPAVVSPKKNGELTGVQTLWKAKKIPKIVPGQVAMIYHETEHIAEAATVDRIDETSGAIHLHPNQLENQWLNWPKSVIALHVSPRWKRKCWLNGDDVIRTEKPHGISEGAYISWSSGSQRKYAKVTEVDKQSLRLELNGSLPKKGTKLIIARQFEGDKLPADYEEIVLINNDGEDKEPKVEPVTHKLVEPDYPTDIPNPLFEIKKIFSIDKGAGGGGGGGGLLPPASLPKIGSFLFPSPMLPMDLVKAAVEMLLSMGVMQVPSTGEFVIKGLPFGGMLEGATDLTAAATQFVKLLDDMKLSAKWSGGKLVDLQNNPIYFEMTCKDGQIPDLADGVTIVNSQGVLVESSELECLNGKVVDSSGQVVGYQPFSSPSDNTPIQFQLTDWDQTVSNQQKKIADMEKLLENAANDPTVLFKSIDKTFVDETGEKQEISGPLLAVPRASSVQAVVGESDPFYMFNGDPDKLKDNDWVVGQFTNGLKALNIGAINRHVDDDKTESFSLIFKSVAGNEGELQQIYADFRGELTADGTAVNETPIDPEAIELEEVPESLKIGQTVLLSGCGEKPAAVKIKEIDGNVIKFNPPVVGCIKGNLVVHANVALAGHGEIKPTKIIGSGNATKSNQEFTLEIAGISFVSDATKRSGVAAAIDVEVAGRIWEQVSTLKDSTPGDLHYAIRMTEEGFVKILFGDGEYGRRLPTGKNNIRVRYRVGSGLAGNVPAGGLEKPVNPHPLIKAVTQPLNASGGGDMEGVTSLRENAPSTLLALERAVSLSDFSHLAAAQSSVWQAKAFSQILHGGRTESVQVVIVPAGGVSSVDTRKDVEGFLQQHALPGVRVTVDDYKKNLVNLSILIRVKADSFNVKAVEKAVTLVLLDHFSLAHRKLGAHLYLSEVYKIVEGVKGVENSICVLNDDVSLQLIKAESDRMVVYLDTETGDTPSKLKVTPEEYQS